MENNLELTTDTKSSIVYGITYTHVLEDFSFGNIPQSIIIETFKDGRAFSHFIEPWLAINYPLIHVKGCKKHDHTDIDNENVCEFTFGDEQGHNNKITYHLKGDIKELNLKLPFNSDIFKTILHVNKDMEEGKLYLSNMGLMKLEFKTENITSEYFLIRKSETSY